MVQAPTPHEEDRRRISRERETLTAERVQHVNRIKGLLFAQGIGDYEPLHRNRRERLEELITGDGRPLPECLKAQISRELDRLELVIEQVKAVEAQRDAWLAQVQASPGVPAQAWPSRQDDDCRPGAQAAGRALEGCNSWRSDRGSRPQARLSTALPPFPQ